MQDGREDIALANLSSAPNTIVSYLRAHPSVNYVVASTNSVTMGCRRRSRRPGSATSDRRPGRDPTDIQYLHSGQQAADVAFPYYEVMYAMTNAAIQAKAGMPVLASVAPPKWSLSPANAPQTTATVFPVVEGYKAQYEALWGM